MNHVPGYLIETELGRGGIGVVYRAVQRSLARPVALKIPIAKTCTPSANERFLREVRALTDIKHPHVVTVLDSGNHGGRWWYAMELLDGATLHHLAHEAGGLAPFRALALFAQAADALAACHARGITHRDIKPANFFVSPADHLTLMDFGLVRGFDHRPITTVGKVMGTPMYLAPELLIGEAASPASDVYALGLTFHEVLAGEAALPQLPLLELIDAILHQGPRPLRSRCPQLPRGLPELVDAMTSRDARDRPALREVAERLEALARGPAKRSAMMTQAMVRPRVASPVAAPTQAMVASRRWSLPRVCAALAAGALVAAMSLTHRADATSFAPCATAPIAARTRPAPARLDALRRTAQAPGGALHFVRALAANPLALNDLLVPPAVAAQAFAQADAAFREQSDRAALSAAAALRFAAWRRHDLLERLDRRGLRCEPLVGLAVPLWQLDPDLRAGAACVAMEREAREAALAAGSEADLRDIAATFALTPIARPVASR